MTSAHRPKQHIPKASTVGRHVAQQVRLRRQAIGLTQRQLAELIGTTSQQVQRYEKGTNRVSAGQLYAIALGLGTDVASFFDSIQPDPVDAGKQDHQRRLVQLMHNVQRIGSHQHRQAFCAVARALAELSDQQPAEPA